MKVTQYMTTQQQAFVKKPVFPSTPMGGALTVTAESTCLSRDFLGFGVAITGSSCYLLSTMQPTQRREFLEDIYTDKGLDLSVARLSVGSSDYSAELYSYDDVENDVELKHFSIERDKAYIIPMIREILAVKPDLYLFASPWSPPGWMKTGGSMCGGYMREEFLECYADYYVRFLQEYEKCGIHISALTPQNEPETHQKGKMPACMWHPDLEAKFIRILRKKLDEQGLDVKIWMYDHNFVACDYRVRWMLDQCKGLSKACDGIAFHYYEGAIEQTHALRAAYPNLRMHFTEGGPRLYDHYSTDFCKWGIMMCKALNLNFGSFTGWNLMLDETGGPNIGPFFCGGLVTRNSEDGPLSYSGQYRAFSHISKFMQPGATVRATCISDNTSGMFEYPAALPPLHATLLENPDGSRIYILVNPDEKKKKQVQLNLNGTYHYVELLPDSISTVVVEKD